MKYEGLMLKETSTNVLCTTPQMAYEAFKDSAKLAQETFSILTLNTKTKIIHERLVSIGTLNSSIVHPRDVFKPAIMDNAAAVILSHNHPSGDPTPSPEDIKVTKQLISAGEIMGIKVLDHVIIGDNERFLSLRESGLCNFN